MGVVFIRLMDTLAALHQAVAILIIRDVDHEALAERNFRIRRYLGTIADFTRRNDFASIQFARSPGPGLVAVELCKLQEAPLIKLDIINHVVNQTGLARNKTEKAVGTVFEGIKGALTRGERVEFRGFGIFEVRARKTGIGRNPRNNIEVHIQPGKSIRFRPGKGLRDLE